MMATAGLVPIAWAGPTKNANWLLLARDLAWGVVRPSRA